MNVSHIEHMDVIFSVLDCQVTHGKAMILQKCCITDLQPVKFKGIMQYHTNIVTPVSRCSLLQKMAQNYTVGTNHGDSMYIYEESPQAHCPAILRT